MTIMPKEIKVKLVKRLRFDLKNRLFAERIVAYHSATNGKIYLPKDWEGKSVLVVLKDD
jgi:putative transposon-encoded protein